MVKVFKSSYKFGETEPWWDTEELTMSIFCNCNKYLPIRFTVFSYTNAGDPSLYGRVTTTTRDIEMLADSILKLKKTDNGPDVGHIKFN